MKRILFICLLAFIIIPSVQGKQKTVTLRLVQTSDVHGAFFPYDYINRQPKAGTLARVNTYVNRLRKEYGENVILLDNGDILQGQPTCYFYNVVNTEEPHVAAEIINYMKYDAETMGNHDVETGHPVFDKWIKEVNCPMLGANIIDVATNQPYVSPYTILNRQGVKVAVIGMLTPAIPNWLTEDLWKGLRFDEMVKTARHWVKHVKEVERADVIIGLFHSGKEGGIKTIEYEEDATLRVAKEVPGFDLVFFGHDHSTYNGTVTNVNGDNVLCLNPSNNAIYVCDATIDVTLKGKKVVGKQVSGQVMNITKEEIDPQFMEHFQPHIDKINEFVNRKIGVVKHSIYTRDSYFGSSAFIDFILNKQLEITGADIAFNAPLSFDAAIKEGDLFVSDMFNLYRFENQLYVMQLTGKEICKHLEMSYDLWVNTMTSPDDHLLLLSENMFNNRKRISFANYSFNFDSAAGIDYEVDVTKPNGEKVRILQMSNGEPFDESKWYKVAVNSYRGNGGGELLTQGAGIPKDSLDNRIIWRSEKDLRFYLMKEIEKTGIVDAKPNNNWRFVPEEWVQAAAERDRAILFTKPKE